MTTESPLTPLYGRVLIKPIDDQVSKGGVILAADTEHARSLTATVVAVWEGDYSKDGLQITPLVKPGDRVLVGMWNGYNCVIDGEDHTLVHYTDIHAIVKDTVTHIGSALNPYSN